MYASFCGIRMTGWLPVTLAACRQSRNHQFGFGRNILHEPYILVKLGRAEYGDERIPAMRDHLRKISPLSHVDKIKIPMLVIQVQNDPRVPLTETVQMVGESP